MSGAFAKPPPHAGRSLAALVDAGDVMAAATPILAGRARAHGA